MHAKGRDAHFLSMHEIVILAQSHEVKWCATGNSDEKMDFSSFLVHTLNLGKEKGKKKKRVNGV